MEKFNINSLPLIKLLIFIIPSLIIGIQLPSSFTLLFVLFFSILGIVLLIFKKHNFFYVLLSITIGLILSLNFRQAKTLKSTNHYKTIYSSIFGKVTDFALFDTNKVILRVSGYIQDENLGKYSTSVQLTIYDTTPAVRMIEVGDYILCKSWIRLPRKSKLPTDPPEVHIALINDVEFFGTVYSNGVVKIWKERTSVQKFLKNLNVFVSDKLSRAFEPPSQPYFFALLLGNRKYLSIEQKEKFAITGMSHILALSGFHFGILATILFYLFSFLKNKWLKFVLISIALIAYLIAVSLPPSGIRATIMILAFLFALTLERDVQFLNILGLILIVVLIFFPTTIFTIGFQLSFVAVLGIGLFYKKFYQFFINLLSIKNKLILYIISVLCLTLSAQVFTTPLVAYYFGYYTFISFFSNLILLPLFTLSIIFGFVTILISFISSQMGKPFATTADFILSLANGINDWIASKFETFVVTENGVTILSIIVSIAVVWILMERQPKRILVKFLFAVCLVCLLVYNIKESYSESTIEIYPRLKYVAVVLKSRDKNYCLLLDRKPHQFPSNDKPMVDYLARLPGDLLVGVSGNAGIAVSDNLKARRKVTLVEVPSEVQRKISYAIFGDLSLFKRWNGF